MWRRHGTLTRTDADCGSVTYTAGQSLVEPSGSRHVHVGRNLGTEPVELYVTYVNPIGSPLSVDAPDPGCGEHPAAHPSNLEGAPHEHA